MSSKRREELLARYSLAELKEAYQGLSVAYRESTGSLRTLSDKERAAYLYVRFPATYAVCLRVAEELLLRTGSAPVSMIDLGCGPATGSLAFSALFPSLKSFTLVDRDKGFLNIARAQLGDRSPQVVASNLDQFMPEEADLALFSYALNELDETARKAAIQRAWQRVQTIIIIEPGTKRGFEIILAARDMLLALGGKIVAPCPHEGACPWRYGESWCHFSVRVERDAEHRVIKEGSLGFEDEKYAYLIVTKGQAEPVHFRLMGDLSIRKNCVEAKVCTHEGDVRNWVIPKSMKPLYKEIKKCDWGDGFNT